MVRPLTLNGDGLLIDLGCSDGFVVADLRDTGALPATWRINGYDHEEKLLVAARSRHIVNAEFRWIDLNDSGEKVLPAGDLVVCLETLEHVGDWRSALAVIDSALDAGSLLLLSLPNEVGMIGLAKLIGRPLLRPRPYGAMLPDVRATLKYAARVALHRDISYLRLPPRSGWAPHLGFDYREVLAYIARVYVESGQWHVEAEESSFLGSNRFLQIRKTGTGTP